MLSFDRGSLESKAARVDGRLAPADAVWQADDPKPAEPIRVTGRLSSAGAGRFYFSGHFEGVVDTECRRCLEPVALPVRDDLHLLFAEVGDEEADENDVYMLDPRAREIDLRPALREEWLLAVPHFALCRDDCQGLCPRCGANLNEAPCDCERETDARWSALDELRTDT